MTYPCPQRNCNGAVVPISVITHSPKIASTLLSKAGLTDQEIEVFMTFTGPEGATSTPYKVEYGKCRECGYRTLHGSYTEGLANA